MTANPRVPGLGAVARKECSFCSAVIFLAREVAAARPELDCQRPRFFLVAVEAEVVFPLARRDQPVGDVAQSHDRAQRAVGDAVLERRGHALLGHRIGAFDDCERGLHFPNAAYQRVNVNLAAGGWDIFRDDAVRKQEGDAAGYPGVYAQDWRGAAMRLRFHDAAAFGSRRRHSGISRPSLLSWADTAA